MISYVIVCTRVPKGVWDHFNLLRIKAILRYGDVEVRMAIPPFPLFPVSGKFLFCGIYQHVLLVGPHLHNKTDSNCK